MLFAPHIQRSVEGQGNTEALIPRRQDVLVLGPGSENWSLSYVQPFESDTRSPPYRRPAQHKRVDLEQRSLVSFEFSPRGTRRTTCAPSAKPMPIEYRGLFSGSRAAHCLILCRYCQPLHSKHEPVLFSRELTFAKTQTSPRHHSIRRSHNPEFASREPVQASRRDIGP